MASNVVVPARSIHSAVAATASREPASLRRPRRAHGRENAAAGRVELLVARAARAQRELVDAVAGEAGVRVAVDEPRDGAEPAAVDLLDLAVEPRPQLAHRTDGGDSPVLAEDVRVLDDLDPAERVAAKRRLAAGGRRELCEVADEQPPPARPVAHSADEGGIGSSSPCSLGGRDRLRVAGVGVAEDARARIGREHALEPLGHLVAAVGDDDHARVDRVADPDAAAVMDADPRRARGDVEQRVQDRPVGDRVGAVPHRLGLAVRRGDRAGVEVIAADHDGRLDLAGPDELVDREPGAGAIAVAEPADPRRQALEGDALGRQLEPALEQRRRPGRARAASRRWRRCPPVAGERRPAERPDAAAEERPDIGRDEARV